METGETLLLEDLIAERIQCQLGGAVEIVGRPGAGKTWALAHLASLPFADRLVLLDEPKIHDLQFGTAVSLTVYTTRTSSRLPNDRYELAPWCDDDLIEYMLNVSPSHCGSVMTRFAADSFKGMLEGAPELFCLVAQQMAAHHTIRDIRTALRRAIAELAGDDQTLGETRHYAAAVLLGQQNLSETCGAKMIRRGVSRQLLHMLGYRVVQILLAADHLISVLDEHKHPFPIQRLPRALVAETAELAHSQWKVISRLRELVGYKTASFVPMAASILHLADSRWHPRAASSLHGAYFSRADWKGLDLSGINLTEADLSRAELQGANLERSRLVQANLRGSQLASCCLSRVRAYQADFSNADLTYADISSGLFAQAQFTGAILDRVSAAAARFQAADLSHASLRGANLLRGNFRGALLQCANFENADLRNADLAGLMLRDVVLTGADLSGSNLSGCDLEFAELPEAQFRYANLEDSWLTGSVMGRGDFRHARLRRAGLADIDWEKADLRDADLSDCSFHMGSTRSGLVGSPYPCHGSRTGFYTNDYDEQSFKAPEEIRKANLCGADLRGAVVEGVDFYLVDLRGAKYDARQRAHFEKCDAILVDRAR